jgi:formate hydrogenlyase subunit 3/multisubunit Na+/H+ antiporter MnhD subunit
MHSFIAGMAAGIVIVGLLPLLFWIDVVLHGGRIKLVVVAAVIVTMVFSLWLTIALDRFTAKFILLPGAVGVVALWLLLKWKNHKGTTRGPHRRIPAQAKCPFRSPQTEEELPPKAADGRNARFKGELA